MIRIIIMTIIPNPDQMTIFRMCFFSVRETLQPPHSLVQQQDRKHVPRIGPFSKDPVMYVLIHSLLIFNIFSDTYYIKAREKLKWK